MLYKLVNRSRTDISPSLMKFPASTANSSKNLVNLQLIILDISLGTLPFFSPPIRVPKFSAIPLYTSFVVQLHIDNFKANVESNPAEKSIGSKIHIVNRSLTT